MNKKYRALALVLSMLTLSSCGIFKNFGKNKDTTPKINSEYIYNGTHVYTATDRNDYLVKNGRTDYTLVIPSESSASMRVARSEFVDLFKDATGIAINNHSINLPPCFYCCRIANFSLSRRRRKPSPGGKVAQNMP